MRGFGASAETIFKMVNGEEMAVTTLVSIPIPGVGPVGAAAGGNTM